MTARITTGAWPLKSTSSNSRASVFSSANAEWAFLIAIGLAGVVAHSAVHLPIKLPGHHGLEWMALLLFARTLSTNPWAATIAATSAAGVSYLPLWGFNEASMGLSYLISGWLVDAMVRVVRSEGATVRGLIAALAHVSKPLWKWAAAVGLGLHFGSVEKGVAFAVMCHLAFGMVGGTAGAIAGLGLRKQMLGR